jgi:ATP-binding protein involved in chromosome partitioning
MAGLSGHRRRAGSGAGIGLDFSPTRCRAARPGAAGSPPQIQSEIPQMAVEQQAVLSALQEVLDPNTGKDFVSTKALKNLQIAGGDVSFDVELGYPAKSQLAGIRKLLIAAAKGVAGVTNVSVNVGFKIASHSVQRGVQLLPNVKNIVAVASGKGGVGKSTTAVNLALALAAEGAQVGLLDADIYGPSQPMMMGIEGRPESVDGKNMEPMENYGIQVMSIGFLVAQDEAMIWRGPMATQALEQLLRQTNWKDLDYLIVDMPPGTGDIQLTLSQRVPMTGAVIVTTPQDIALLDAKKGIKMFEKVGVPILGIVENMAVHVCSQCGHTEHIFGEDGGKKMAADYGMSYLGALPLDMQIRLQADNGRPTVVADPDGEVAGIYKAVARQVAITIAAKAKDFSAKFPTITISKNT